MEIFPSLISSDLLNLGRTLTSFDAVCHGYHIDVMDDHFVPNLTWGPMFINAIRAATPLPLHIHLMVARPASFLDRMALRAGDTVIFHGEAVAEVSDQRQLIDQIRAKGFKVGVALNPRTAAERIFDVLPLLDTVLIMSVEPGFSGQSFIPEVIKKIKPLRALCAQLGKHVELSVDGGVNDTNIAILASLGVDNVAVASAIFSQPDPLAALQRMYGLAHQQ